MQVRRPSFATSWILAAVLLAAPGAATAQQEQPAEGEEAPQFTEEVTVRVTARKREENLQSVPFSIVAPTQQVLRNRGAASLEDVAANVAGFSIQNLGPGQSQIAIRGVSAGQIVRDQPGVKEQVGVYLDESVISLSLFTPDIDLFDMSRVEVLRGPQGTLFGSGSLSGTVRYITNQPELGVLEGTGELGFDALSAGGFGNNTKVAINIPLGGTAAARVTAYNTVLGGFMDAVQPDGGSVEDVNSGRRSGARVAVLVQPNERLSITPRVIYQDVSMDGWNRIDAYNILANPFTTTRPAFGLGERELFTQIEEPFGDQFLLGDLKVEYDFGNVLLTSITSVTDRDVEVVRDSTALAASVAGGTIGLGEDVYTLDAPLIDTTTARAVTEELRLSGIAGRVNWVGGLFYSDAERRYGQSLPITGFEAASGIPTMGDHAAQDELFFSNLLYDFDQVALFGELSVAVTERFNLTGGLRWYDFDEQRVQTFDGIYADAGTNEGGTTATGVAPRLIASYDVTDGTQVNGQVSKGFRLGGINDPLNTPICTPRDLETFGNRGNWEDEELWNYEAGAKSTFLGGRGTLNVSGFYMDIRNLQATVTAGSCSSRIIFNVPEARSAGMELEIAAQPNAPVRLRHRGQRCRRQAPVDPGVVRHGGQLHRHHRRHRGGQAPADHAAVPGHRGRDVALADGQLGRLSERHFPTRRVALHPDRRPGGRFWHGQPAGAAQHDWRAVDARHVPFQSGAAGLQHPEHPDRRAQRHLGHRLLRQQRHRRARLPGARPGARDAGPGRLSDQSAAAFRRRHALRFIGCSS